MVCKVKLNRKILCCQHLNNSFLGFLWQHNFYISLQSVCIKKIHNGKISQQYNFKDNTTVLCLFTVKYDIQINKRSTVKLKYEG